MHSSHRLFGAFLGLVCCSLLHGQNPAPANANLSPNARNVLSFIQQQFGQKILSGQEESPGQLTLDQNAILSATGKRPAIRGFDVRFQNPNAMTEAANSWNNHRQIVTFSWHMGLPPNGSMTDADDTFSSSQSSIDGATYDAIITPGTTRYNNLMTKLQRQADRLQVLADADVPVLWRPFHEHEADGGSAGGWFWWSDINGDVTRFTRLWSIMYDYFVNVRQLDNLIWVWGGNKDPLSSAGGTTGHQWYTPIAGKVDLLGTDVYGNSQTNAYWELCYDNLRAIGGAKPVALTENALIPLPDDMVAGDWLYSWFLTWTGSWRQENSTSRLQTVYNHSRVLTADEMPDLRGGGDTTPPSAPTNLASTGKSSTTVGLSWSASSDANGIAAYDVYAGASLEASVPGTSATVVDLDPSTTYSFTVRARDPAGNTSAASSPLSVTTNSSAGVTTFQAEQASHNGTVDTGSGGYTGAGYVNMPGGSGTITWTFTPSAGSGDYVFRVRYVNGDSGDRPGSLAINGGTAMSHRFPSTGGWSSWGVATFTGALSGGNNTLVLSANNGPHVDYLAVERVTPAANTPPTISNLADQTIVSGSSTGPLAFTVGDAESSAGSLTVSGSSSNTTLVPTTGIVFGGSGSSRTVNVTPASSQTGSATVTVIVSDGALTASDAFVLSVTSGGGGGANLLTNPGFETGTLPPWSGSNEYISGITRTGSYGGRIGTSGGSAGTIQQTVTGLSPGTTYTLTAWIRMSATGSSATLGVDGYGGSTTASPVSSTTWTQRSITFTTGSSATSARVYLTKPANSGQLGYLDDVTLTHP